MAAMLVGSRGPLMGEMIPIRGPRATLGRLRHNEVYIPEAHVAGRHAEIVVKGARYYIRDLGSANGTFVNGHRIPVGDQLPLNDGDGISLGGASFVFHLRATHIGEEAEGYGTDGPP